MKRLLIAFMLIAGMLGFALSTPSMSGTLEAVNITTVQDLASDETSESLRSGELSSELRKFSRPPLTKVQACWRFDDCARRCRLEWQNYHWKSAKDCIDNFPCSKYPKKC